ncbi:progranulin [Oncorhynchus mykiss]|uniref:progranulin n=1 Tax=Oncorhynchus mykiss TaxID=8022 RepID=UPI001877D022|nr:progranulin [Oncorhynchus mykiss]
MTVQIGVACLALLGLTSALICPDGGMCAEGNTCCKTPSGGYGCCPLPNAECCSDHLHCCYEGTVCDLVHSKCLNKTVSLPWVRRVPAKRLIGPLMLEGVKAVICPDGEAECPDDTTCCELPGGTWGCCPLAKAVCCEDKMHCCPESTKCDLAHSKCVSPTLDTFPMREKVPARKSQSVAVVGRAVTCPGGKSLCPDGTTCCLLASGDFGCCPYPEAVCCFDKLHCCPGNTTCDLEHEMCTSPNTQTPLAKKIPAIPNDVNAVPCNDSVACADGSTCCKSLDGEWVCCPLPKAVCCDDHLHCCPHGTICNLAESTCDDPSSGSALVPMLDKVPAFSYVSEEKPLPNTKCDESTSCPGQSTCCETTTGNWACCPLPNAMCCNDHLHCCPHGTVCNLEASTCHRSSPPQAVCCADGDHCCPSGYSCDDQKTCCTKGLTIPWYRKEKALTVGAMLKDVKCDNKSSCASGTTCCKLPTEEWGCCPLVKAVCCTDHEHCCPQGYSCNMQTGTCEKPVEGVLPHTIPQTKVAESQQRAVETGIDVKCDGAGEYSCPKLQTCCKTSPTEWSCCPEPKAVCCADAKHCCPMGYTCNLGQGGCSQQAELTWDIFFTRNKKRDFVPFGL